MNTAMKFGGTVVVIVLIVLGFWMLKWSEQKKEIDRLESSKKERQAQLERLERDVAELPKFLEEEKKLEAELNSLVQARFTKEEPELFVANYIAEIERMVLGQQIATEDYSFKIESISPKGQQMAGGSKASGGVDDGDDDIGGPATESETLQGFPTRVFDMKLTGKYSTLIDFLYELGNLELDRLVTINKITLAPQSGEGGISPVLNVTIPVTAYLRQGSR